MTATILAFPTKAARERPLKAAAPSLPEEARRFRGNCEVVRLTHSRRDIAPELLCAANATVGLALAVVAIGAMAFGGLLYALSWSIVGATLPSEPTRPAPTRPAA